MMNNTNISSCAPAQQVALSLAINDISEINIIGCDGKAYDESCLNVSWSMDGVSWTCFVDIAKANKLLINASSDFYVKYKVNGTVTDVKDGDESVDYTTSIATGLTLPSCGSNANNYNPYSLMSSALQLQQSLSDSVACMIGIPIYYFKLKPNTNSKDLTFKEYTLMNVDSVKQIKLIVNDGQMPSSKPEFSDFGLDWQTDWETEISKTMFVTAFGDTAQPMEGDLVYVPMQKRMWMVNEAYEEKNGSLMWVNTTFKVALVKYQEKGSVDLGDIQDTVDSLVQTKYEDLFGDQESLDSGVEAADSPLPLPDSSYNIYMSDATRKYVTCESTQLVDYKTYNRATAITERAYKFVPSLLQSIDTKIVYQRKYCGDEGAFSVILGIDGMMNYECNVLDLGNIQLHVKTTERRVKIYVPQSPKLTAYIKNISLSIEDNTYFVYCRWSKKLNISELGIVQYSHSDDVPLYKMKPVHYVYDFENQLAHEVEGWNIEMMQDTKQDVVVHGFPGIISNIKVFDAYIDDMATLLQEYPNHQHLLINDAVRPIVDMNGSGIG